MIDLENYERVTVKGNRVNNRIPLEQIKGIMTPLCDVYNRLAELEDLIEQKRLLPAFFVTKTTYGFWTIGSYTKEYYCYGFDTKQEAETKLKELMESEENE